MIHPSYEIVRSCQNCNCVHVLRIMGAAPIFYCNSDNSEVPSWSSRGPEDEDKDEYEHWTVGRLVAYNGFCDNYKQDFTEMVAGK